VPDRVVVGWDASIVMVALASRAELLALRDTAAGRCQLVGVRNVARMPAGIVGPAGRGCPLAARLVLLVQRVLNTAVTVFVSVGVTGRVGPAVCETR
jgi:hypothetical protein